MERNGNQSGSSGNNPKRNLTIYQQVQEGIVLRERLEQIQQRLQVVREQVQLLVRIGEQEKQEFHAAQQCLGPLTDPTPIEPITRQQMEEAMRKAEQLHADYQQYEQLRMVFLRRLQFPGREFMQDELEREQQELEQEQQRIEQQLEEFVLPRHMQ
ncbi:hypothetical protein AALP_AA8G307800 [Arabis alpina]|uniref:Uncharacterized protein n=1 Tax=Arabis alpina TaxID=50452 RepID=A0A087GAJ6_ARAAL|nr:hypothetical protein AALP_AA8G307800 [Arabis alpina]